MLSTLAGAQTAVPLLIEHDGFLRVTAKINGKSLLLIVDTAAQTSLIKPEAINIGSAKLAKLRKIRLNGTGGHGSQVPLMPLEVGIAGRAITIDFGITELPDTLPKCDGILGNDLLSQFDIVTINYKTHTIELAKVPR